MVTGQAADRLMSVRAWNGHFGLACQSSQGDRCLLRKFFCGRAAESVWKECAPGVVKRVTIERQFLAQMPASNPVLSNL